MIVFLCLCSLEMFAWPLCHEFWGVLLLLLVGALSSTASSRGHDIWPSKNAKFLADCPGGVSNGIMVKKIGKMIGSRKEILFLSNPKSRTCFFSACCIPIVNKITYCEAAWKNSSRWTKKPEVSLSQMNIESLTVSTCFNKQVQNKMFSQHVGGRSMINMVSWHREIPSWNPELGKHQWLDDERSCRKKMHIADCLTMFNNLSCTFLHIYMIM
jgi:hypothetical protein